jgi:hypothetical protein
MGLVSPLIYKLNLNWLSGKKSVNLACWKGRNTLKNQQCQLLANSSKNMRGVNIKALFSKSLLQILPAGGTLKKCPPEMNRRAIEHLSNN